VNRLSIRSQVVLLVALLLLLAMASYLTLATRVITTDKEATVYDVNALVAGTVAEQVSTTIDALSDKLRYFGQEYETTPGDVERRARSLFSADDEVLSLEVYKRGEGAWERSFLFVDAPRLSALNLSPEDLQAARRETPVPLDGVVRAQVVLQNASLAPDLALLRLSVASRDGKAIVTADLRPERLLRTVGGSSVYRVFIVDAEGRVLAHPEPARVIAHADLSAMPVVKQAFSAPVARGADEYDWEGSRRLASYARLAQGFAAVVVEVPRDQVFSATRELSSRSLLFAGGVVALALVLALWLSRRMVAPLKDLQRTMAVISRGEFGVEVPIDGPAEIRSVGLALNEMSRELVRRADQLSRTQAELVQSEKLSAIGELSASVAHEVKNPMVGIVGFSQLGADSLDVKEMHDYFRLIEGDALRANKILQNLLEFARPPDVELEPLDVNDVVAGTLVLCRHQLRMEGVEVDTTLLEPLPLISGSLNQLRQVLLNLLMNAGHALREAKVKQVHVTTTLEGDRVRLTVTDTGPGMSTEVMAKLFKPFFTTKRRGEGTGLGLSVSRSIIEAHHGTINVESASGQGATFVLEFPVRLA
jgi:signal transduction histidine kinase